MRAGFSDWRPGLDLFAPGVAITSTAHTSDTAKATCSGTSMASPHAAGAVALCLAEHRGADPAQALTGQAVKGKVRGKGAGSPNRLLQVNHS